MESLTDHLKNFYRHVPVGCYKHEKLKRLVSYSLQIKVYSALRVANCAEEIRQCMNSRIDHNHSPSI